MLNLAEIRTELLAAELRDRGWICAKDSGQNWETCTAFSRRHGRNKNYLTKLLAKGDVLPGLELHRARGGKGRIVLVRGNAETERWVASR